MPNKLCYIAPVLAAVAAAVIASAPTAAADAAATQPTAIATAPAAVATQTICMSLGGSTSQCQAPGNVQINDAPPPVHYKPQWNDRYLGDPVPPYPDA
jgi:hypothetical protein